MPLDSSHLVLVTGGTGFVGSWVIFKALATGARVRASVRDPADPKRHDLYQALRALPGASERLELVQLNLADSAPAAFERVVAGCTHLCHVASPVPDKPVPKKDEERLLMTPAVQGTLNLLRACAKSGSMQTVVITSALACMMRRDGGEMSEQVFADPDIKELGGYGRSKVLAEKAAWEFFHHEKPGFGMCTMHPYLTIGPILIPRVPASMFAVLRLLNGSLPMLPRFAFGVVDVRDVAEAHIRALAGPREQVSGRRFALSKEHLWMNQMALSLAGSFKGQGYKVPVRVAPDWLLRFVALFDRQLALMVGELGKVRPVDSNPSKDVLGLVYTDLDVALKDAGESLIRFGFLAKSGSPLPVLVASPTV